MSGVVLQSTKEIQDREEYKKRLLLETNRVIDDKNSSKTMLRILQNYYEGYQSVCDSWIIAYKVYIMWLSRFISKLYSLPLD
jgi:hypothetical protein